ncbi:MAG: 3-oxoacyl-[acyl-carrier-protein] reductase [Acidobacteriota bacterium]
MFRLDGKTALVTGASRGIGRAIALRLAERGATVVAAARSVDSLDDLCREIADAGGTAHSLALDLGAPDTVSDQLGALEGDLADIDILVNNAGITRDGLFARMSLAQWREVFSVNLEGAFAVTRHVVRGMMRRRSGRILFVSSVTALMGNPGQTNYAAAKSAMIGFSKSLARELGSRGITVNVVAPGFVETAMTENLPTEARDRLSQAIVLGRLGSVDDIAGPVAFLASDEAAYITGEVLNVSGGLHM